MGNTMQLPYRPADPTPASPIRWQRVTLGGVSGLALIGLAITFIVQSSFESRAVKVQLVRIDPTQHSLFGPVTQDVGQPRLLVLAGPDVLLKNKTALGFPTMDVDYLKKHPGAGLDIEPVESAIQIARIGCILAAAVAGLGALFWPQIRPMSPPLEP